MSALGRRGLLAGTAAAALAPRRVRADNAPLRIGVLTDESGPYADSGGAGSIVAAQMALQDFGPNVAGRAIEIVHADTQNKPEIAAATARAWYDTQSVEAIVDLPVTPVAAAVQQVAREKRRTVMITAAAVTDFTTRLCAPVSTHWADDTHALTTSTARNVVARGGRTWFFITVDFTFGHALEAAATAVITGAGGSVAGHAYFPIGNTDFASQILQAQAAGVDVIGCAAVGGDQVNLIKQAAEFGVLKPAEGAAKAPTMAAFLVYITDIHALGLAACQGLTFSSGFYWDQSDATRAFGRRFQAARGAMPTRNQASVYLSVMHYLRAAAQAGSADALAVNTAMRGMPVDYFGRPAAIRADGRAIYDLTLYRVRAPAESHGDWDYYAPVATLPAAQGFLTMVAGCGGPPP